MAVQGKCEATSDFGKYIESLNYLASTPLLYFLSHRQGKTSLKSKQQYPLLSGKISAD